MTTLFSMHKDPPSEPKTVLILDDNEICLFLVTKKVGKEFKKIVPSQAVDGNAGFIEIETKILKEGSSFDVIITDVDMPECDGIVFTRQVRALEKSYGLTRTPIIVVTSSPDLHNTTALEAGANIVFGKQVTAKELNTTITRLTNEARRNNPKNRCCIPCAFL